MDGGEETQDSTQSSGTQSQGSTSNDITGSNVGRDFERVRSGDLINKSNNTGSYENKIYIRKSSED